MNKFLFNGYTLYHEKIIFKEYQSGLLCELDINTGAIRYIDNLKDYQVEINPFDNLIERKGKIYAVTNDGKKMMIYDTVQNGCEWIPIDYGVRQWGNFTNVFDFNEHLFFFHKEENWISCYDVLSKRTEKIVSKACCSNVCSCRIGNKVWIFPRNGDIIQEFNLETKAYAYHELSSELELVNSCAYDKDKIYLLTDYGKIYVIRQKDFYVEVMDFGIEEDISKSFGRIICAAGKLIMFPAAGNDIGIVELDKKTMNVFSEYPKDFSYADIAWSKYYAICEDEDYYYLLRKSNYLLKIKKSNGDFIWTRLMIKDACEKEKWLFRYKYMKEPMWEGAVSLDVLIKNIPVKENDVTKNTFIGSEIWKKIT